MIFKEEVPSGICGKGGSRCIRKFRLTEREKLLANTNIDSLTRELKVMKKVSIACSLKSDA